MAQKPKSSALILVDIQNDFMPSGALPVPNGTDVIPVANALIPIFSTVFATQDWHPPNHGSFAQTHGAAVGSMGELGGLPQVMWPVHCVQQSPGAAFVDGLALEGVTVIQKGTDVGVDSYSGFFDNGRKRQTDLHQRLQSEGVTDVYIMGVATDYCVLFTTLDALDLGYKTTLVADGCRGVDLNDGDVARAVEQIAERGAMIMQSDEVLT